MRRLAQSRVRNRRRLPPVSCRSLLAGLLLLALLAGCSGSTGTAGSGSAGTATGSEAAGPADGQSAVETTAGSADGTGAGTPCTRTKPETIGRILDITPAGAPEPVDGDPVVLIGAPRGLVSFTGCSIPFTVAGLDGKVTVDIYVADGGHDDFERIRSSATAKVTSVPDLGDEAFTAMTLQTLVIARKGSQIVAVDYLVQNEENTIKVAREVLADL
jgi:hypothetical protein